ncbi:MAG: glycosyltransferase family 4 protein, partial [Gammaproteobacteria bacterium]
SVKNPLHDLVIMFRLLQFYRLLQPVLVHHVSLKVILLGGPGALLAGVPVIINALTGLGYAFSSNSRRAALLRLFIRPLLGLILKRDNSRTVVQNPDDMQLLQEKGLTAAERTVLIKGAGIDTNSFYPADFPPEPLRVILPARLLADKGVYEFVKAAELLAQDNATVRMILVGDVDPDNPLSIEPLQLQEWSDQGTVEWWGYRQDMLEVYHQAHVVCLPSYREGFPKVLLEAAACGRPLIATDVPGCREAVVAGKTGTLVPVKNAAAIAAAVKYYLTNSDMIKAHGKAGYEFIINRYTTEIINKQTVDLYNDTIQTCIKQKATKARSDD